MTAAQRRAHAKETYDAYLANCASRALLERLGNKWTVLVLSTMADGEQRYSDIARTVGGISAKMLAQTLRHLERDGLVTRRATATVPPRVDYDLTDLGASLLAAIRPMKTWAEHHMRYVEAARAEFDTRAPNVPLTSAAT